jgi:hypothetical protein
MKKLSLYLLFASIGLSQSQPVTTFIIPQEVGTSIFFDAFDFNALDTTFNWKTPVTGVTGSTSYSQGTESIIGGTTANSFAVFQGQKNWSLVTPGWLVSHLQGQISPAIPPNHTYAFIGRGFAQVSPTQQSYCVDCVGYEVQGTPAGPVWFAVSWAGGTRNSIQQLPPISDGGFHPYVLFERGRQTEWVLNDVAVAARNDGVLGPNTNVLPLLVISGSDSVGAATALTVNLGAADVGDTSASFEKTLDPCASQTKLNLAISDTAAGGSTLITGVVGKKLYVCTLNLVNTTAAQTIQITEGTTASCGTGTLNLTGIMAFGANQVFVSGNGDGTIVQSGVAGNNMCLSLGAATQVSGNLIYTVQ